ncbi:MAG: gliding motility-associated C-terminal domain-containing protein [Bacteroidales bacterium]|nr:gliding motility-associated C-terminal domain-containing protein [Bacteroidales bacterium]
MRKYRNYIIPFFLLLFLLLPGKTFSQFSAGKDDTINPGVPVTLAAEFGLLANGVNTLDNRVEGPFSIGFPFTFYGESHTSFSIGENGWISFTHQPNWGATRNIRLPSASTDSPKDCILGAMEDYNPIQAGSPYIYYQTVGEAPNRKLVVMWCQCPMFGCNAASVTFQIVLIEGDTIEIHIYNKPVCLDWDNKCTIGIQNDIGYSCDTLPNQNRNSTSFSVSQEGWRFVPTSSDTYEVTQIPYYMEPITPGDKISYRWYEGTEFLSDQQSLVVSPLYTTTYRAVCTLCSGEEFTDEITVYVVPYIPNAFTPNGDGLNDYFKILGLPPENITKFNLQIFNRWGQVVFATTNILDSWDGRIKDEICPEGDYIWVIFYEDDKKMTTSNKGTVTLLR